uniref:vesicle-fusing ATPase n=1 Tax=Arcella intermedia TaxID=1963864 RepID=A0A6B2LNU0_9EUKA
MQRGIEFMKQAVEEDQKKNYQDALRLYTCGLDYLVEAFKLEKDPKNRQAIKEKLEEYMERAEQLKTMESSHPGGKEEQLQKELISKEETIRKLMEENTRLKAEINKLKTTSGSEELKRVQNELIAAKQKIDELELVWDVVKSVKGQ